MDRNRRSNGVVRRRVTKLHRSEPTLDMHPALAGEVGTSIRGCALGLARRIVRKSLPEATLRSVRKALHPLRTAKNAVTPRSVRKLNRAVYTVTNPLRAAKNALISSAP